ncbi:MAG TPA: LacI family DNA-binding transcriptional regulator [Opitutaceae bacterium]|nr:LacI family DNA-binding transcriptional regulator [Opitutaceae bacterium]
MAGKSAHVTFRQIAKASGFAVATVSYALRGDPKIPPATIARVQAAAEKMGYRPNPRVAALMAHIRRARSVATGERIAFIWLARPGPYQRTHHGARQRAEQLGYELEDFAVRDRVADPRRLERILRTRRITGVVLSPLDPGESSFSLDWDWSRFAPAIIGNAVCTPELHHAGHHHFGAMRLALQKLIGGGRRRIAAIIEGEVNERARRAWSAAFLEHHPARASARRWLQSIDTVDAQGLRRWLAAVKPDSLITTRDMLRRIEAAGINLREEIAETVLLNWTPATAEYGGIDQSEEVIAAHAVDLVVGQLHHNECGAPEHVKMLLFPGKWVEAVGKLQTV